MRAMKVLTAGRPYPGSTGIQFEIYHPQASAYAIYRDLPWPLEQITKHPVVDGDGVFLYRRGDWCCWCLESAEFEAPGKALRAAFEVAKQHVALHGLPELLSLGGAITTEALQQLVDALPEPD